MNRIKILILEDNDQDAGLIAREVRRTNPGAELHRVIRREEFSAALDSFQPDLILSDYSLPDFNGMEALTIALTKCPDTPFLIITGTTNEETAVACMKAGAWNYILKDSLQRLGPAISEALERRRLIAQHQQDARQLAEQHDRLQGVLRDLSLMIRQVIADDIQGALTPLPPEHKACWQVKKCGRKNCPCFGREPLQCWTISGTLCEDRIQGNFSEKIEACRKCNHYRQMGTDPLLRIGMEFCQMIQIVDQKNRELQAAHDNLKATQSHLVQHEKMASIGLLAAGVAHEINNPVGFITSNLGTMRKYGQRLSEYIALLEETLKNCPDSAAGETMAAAKARLKIDRVLEDMPSLLDESLDGAGRVKEIVQSLKSFSRIDQTIQDMADINQCLEETLRIVWNELKYKAAVIKEYGKLPRTWCYPRQLNQVFMNLLVNAGQAIAEQGEIKISTWADQDEIHIAISDSGNGIAPEHLGRIFDPFFTTKEPGKGTGLGLSISCDIVTRQHNGRLEVKSEPGQGTTFSVHLPLQTQPVAGEGDDEAADRA